MRQLTHEPMTTFSNSPALMAGHRLPFTPLLSACLLVTVAACGGDENHPVPAVAFNMCVGTPGSCGDGSCCASESTVHIFGDNVDCTVSDVTATSRYLSFNVWDSEPFRRLEGQVIIYEPRDTSSVLSRACEVFRYTEADDQGTHIYESSRCDAATVEADEGGCEVRVLDLDDGRITGEFTCLELRHDGDADRVMSTVRNGAVDEGTFALEGCTYF